MIRPIIYSFYKSVPNSKPNTNDKEVYSNQCFNEGCNEIISINEI